MKKSKVNALRVIALVTFLFSLFAFELAAQQEPSSTPGAGRTWQRPMMPLIAALDTNNNRIIEADEIEKAPTALKTLDKNSDGKLTEDEYRSQRPERADRQQKPAEPSKEGEQKPQSSEKAGEQQKVETTPVQGEIPAPAQSGQRERRSFVLPIVSALDTNQDQVIDSDEIEKASASLKTLDKNSDGQLAMDEIFPQRSRARESTPEPKEKSEK